MSELRIGERVTVGGRAFEVMGYTPLSVEPCCAFLRDVETGEECVVEVDRLTDDSDSNAPG